MRARVALSTLRRVEALLERARVPGRYLVVPEIMGVDEWEAVAMRMQDDLARSHGDDVAPPPYVNDRNWFPSGAKGVLLFRMVRGTATDIESARPVSVDAMSEPPRPEGW